LCGTTLPDKNYTIYRPSSEVWCIEYVEEGSGTVHVNDETFSPRSGDSYFLHAGKRHYYFSNHDDPWKKYFVNISGRLVDNLVEGYDLTDKLYFAGLDLSNELKQIINIAKDEGMDNTSELLAILNEMFLKMHISTKKSDELSSIGV
jgi:hypothetical protein